MGRVWYLKIGRLSREGTYGGVVLGRDLGAAGWLERCETYIKGLRETRFGSFGPA